MDLEADAYTMEAVSQRQNIKIILKHGVVCKNTLN